ncbi:MAG TPA: hypothetical protein VFA60_15475 [Terriglobales bacterium]|nr:hypothetical protein [Terriglobales bacterium]
MLALCTMAAAAECFPIEEAPKRIGQMACITGKIYSVKHGKNIWYLDFCEDYKTCPFTVVVFDRDLKDPEKLEAFEGHTIRIYGPIVNYKGRAEMALKLEQQLSGEPGGYANNLVPKQKAQPHAPRPQGTGGFEHGRWPAKKRPR